MNTTTPAIPFGPARAEEIYAQRTPLEGQVGHVLTAGERAYVNEVWDTLPGHTSFMDAFHRIRHGRVVVAAGGQR